MSRMRKVLLGLAGLVVLGCIGCGLLALLSPSADEPSVEGNARETATQTDDVTLDGEAAIGEVVATVAELTVETGVEASPTAPEPTETLLPTATLASAESTESGVALSEEEALVADIIDGDTIDVDINGQVYRVRYIGMDTPERGEPFFSEATEANRQLVEGQTVTMIKDVSETDRYGRLLRYVYLPDGTFVNAELVRLGYAQIATYPPDVRHQELFQEMQQEAREDSAGLWAQAIAQVEPTETPLPTDTPIPAPTETPPLPTNTPMSLPTATSVPVPTNTPQPAPTLALPTDTPVPPPPSPADVQITYVFYDGVVARVESDEYAVITNQGGSAVNLGGWRLNADDPGQDFWFPSFDLQPGQNCRVYTNEVHLETCGFSFGYGRAIWNNDGDCGHLYDRSGAEVSTYCY